MAYRIMNTLIKNYEKGSFTKEKLLNMCDVYYGVGRLTDSEYTELVEKINEFPEKETVAN